VHQMGGKTATEACVEKREINEGKREWRGEKETGENRGLLHPPPLETGLGPPRSE
jgi:hypothetical protein